MSSVTAAAAMSHDHLRRRRDGLRFADKRIESEFRAHHLENIIPSMQRSSRTAAASWILAWVYFLFKQPDSLVVMSVITWGVMVPVDVAAFLSTRSERLRPQLERIAAAENLIAGLCMLYVTFGLLRAPDLALGALILTAFYSISVKRLRAKWSALGAVYLGAFIIVVNVAAAQGSDVVTAGQPIYFSIILAFAGLAAFVTAYGLEDGARTNFTQQRIIAEQKAQIEQEKAKSDGLLANMLPDSVADSLKRHESAGIASDLAQAHPGVSVLFADIVGFTAFAQNREPREVVDVLNQIFSRFDELAERHGVEKIKTIGDAYMAAVGLPESREDHAAVSVEFAMAMRASLEEFSRQHSVEVVMRIGIFSGPVVAGVIGKRRFAYDLWGDTVNSASRMESHGVPGQIQVGAPTYELLKDRYEFEDRGLVEVKGKGAMHAYVLRGRRAA